MWRTIARLRQAPKPVRNRYAFLCAASLTSVVGLVWAVAAIMNIGSGGSGENSQPAAPIFSSFFGSAKEQISDLREELRNVSDELESATTSTSTASEVSTTTNGGDSEGAKDGSENDQGTISITTATSSARIYDGPPPGRATGREVRIGTTARASTTE